MRFKKKNSIVNVCSKMSERKVAYGQKINNKNTNIENNKFLINTVITHNEHVLK